MDKKIQCFCRGVLYAFIQIYCHHNINGDCSWFYRAIVYWCSSAAYASGNSTVSANRKRKIMRFTLPLIVLFVSVSCAPNYQVSYSSATERYPLAISGIGIKNEKGTQRLDPDLWRETFQYELIDLLSEIPTLKKGLCSGQLPSLLLTIRSPRQ